MALVKSIPVLALVATLASGCGGTSWPPEGKGGWAEHPRLAAAAPMEPVTDAVFVAKQRLEQIAWDGGSKLFPGRVADARILLVRAEREHVAGFKQDVAITLLSADAVLDDLEQRLSAR